MAPAQREESTRGKRSEQIVRRLDRPMGVLALLFLLVILAQPLSNNRALSRTLTIVSWLLWAVFVAEFVLRPAARLLSKRLAWLAALTLLMLLAASYVLYLGRAYGSYADALHDSALTTISGEPLDSDAPLSQVLELVLAAYSVIVFATLAGSIGAFFLGERKSGGKSGSGDSR